jgi:hypothetical protein
LKKIGDAKLHVGASKLLKLHTDISSPNTIPQDLQLKHSELMEQVQQLNVEGFDKSKFTYLYEEFSL